MRLSFAIGLLCLTGCTVINQIDLPGSDGGANGVCGTQGAACCGGAACNAGLVCSASVCLASDGDGGVLNGDGGNVSDGGQNGDGGNGSDGGVNGDGGTNDGGPMMSCGVDGDCGSGMVCTNAVCVANCTTSSCGTGKYCDTTSHHCVSGCGADAQCSGLSCCGHACVDTQTNPAANCGACGAPACATGNSCCAGVCSDFLTDGANCGSCGNDCGGVACVNGVCQAGYGLFGLFDLTGKVSGSATNREILKPFVYTRAGTLDYQALLNRPCFVTHYDASHPPTDELNAGNVLINGYQGGTFTTSTTAPSDIACLFRNGDYACGYGMITNNMPGAVTGESPFTASSSAPSLSVLGSGTISFSAPGATDFGSFSLTATPSAGQGVMEDLSALTYSGSANTVINIDCGAGGCGIGGFLVYVQASSNDVAHFDEAATAGGSMVCLGGYGGFGGFSLGDPVITISGSDISTMIGGNSSIRTFQTSVITLGQNDLTNIANSRSMDSLGHQVSAFARSGVFGVSHQ